MCFVHGPAGAEGNSVPKEWFLKHCPVKAAHLQEYSFFNLVVCFSEAKTLENIGVF